MQVYFFIYLPIFKINALFFIYLPIFKINALFFIFILKVIYYFILTFKFIFNIFLITNIIHLFC